LPNALDDIGGVWVRHPRRLRYVIVISVSHLITQPTRASRPQGKATTRRFYGNSVPDSTNLRACPRALSKIRSGESGFRYAEGQLQRHGATARRHGERGADYLRRALSETKARPFRHPGNHRYLMRVGRTRSERTRVTIGLSITGYPKPSSRAPVAA
jgi:hypothetical protein